MQDRSHLEAALKTVHFLDAKLDDKTADAFLESLEDWLKHNDKSEASLQRFAKIFNHKITSGMVIQESKETL